VRASSAERLARLCAALLLGSACGPGPAPAVCATVPASCPSPQPGYADVAPIIEARCAPCHFPGGVEAKVHLFATYAEIKKAGVQIDILTQIRGCPPKMPPAGSPPLTDDERATLLGWLYCDAPYDGGAPDGAADAGAP
jgi:hypothetical protein